MSGRRYTEEETRFRNFLYCEHFFVDKISLIARIRRNRVAHKLFLHSRKVNRIK